MQIERERFLGAGRYERTPARQGYANGCKPIEQPVVWKFLSGVITHPGIPI